MADPVHQLVVEPIFPLPPLLGQDLSGTNAVAYMLLTVSVGAAAAASEAVRWAARRQRRRHHPANVLRPTPKSTPRS